MAQFPTDYEEFIYKSRYARWREDLGRREHWPETVRRYMDFMEADAPIADATYEWLYDKIVNFDVMCSMRALMTAGPALARDNTAGFNCSYLPVEDWYAFDEAMYILLCGTGVGFSVERHYTDKLPPLPYNFHKTAHVIQVGDSKEGWAYATRELIECLSDGLIPEYDVSNVRPEGSRLKIFGGRASGPEPLVSLFKFLIETFSNAAGRRLEPIECHDIMCKIGEIVVVGGVRRSAMISLSDLDDEAMAKAKSGEWWVKHPHRALANNSAVYNEVPDAEAFSKEWAALIASKSGERGIFSRKACQAQASKHGCRDYDVLYGTNPCSEIILRPYQFCNLTEVVVRENDTLENLCEKVEAATVLGTRQSKLTNFPYLRPIWQKNTEEERLLGVSLTGIMDHPTLNGSEGSDKLTQWLTQLRDYAVKTNKEEAEFLGIPASAAITCVKPSGTVSQLVNSASGIHARPAQHYLRRVRGDSKDPLTDFMKDQGVPNEPCVKQPETTTVFSFPIAAPQWAITQRDRTALEQLDLWLIYQEHWCEHKPSATIMVEDAEWMDVGAAVYKNFEKISGLSFFPRSDHSYDQAPEEEITAEDYQQWKAKLPQKIDWEGLGKYEAEDNTVASQTLACAGGVCEL